MEPIFTPQRPDTGAEKRHILLFAIIFVLLFAAMCYAFISTALRDKVELFDNDYNRRDELLEQKNRRGAIYASDCDTVLASTPRTPR